MSFSPEQLRFPELSARFGVSRWDITPDLNVSNKNWGATDRWFPTGVHRPLTGSAFIVAQAEESQPLILISLDLGWWRTRADADALRKQLLEELNLPEACLIIHLTHTHAGPLLDSDPPPQAAPEATSRYLERLSYLCIKGVRAGLSKMFWGKLRLTSGHCALAAERDLPDPQTEGRFLTGYHPGGISDNTLLVGQLIDSGGKLRGTLVNYACHPTTLAWDNSLISPDFPGAMRETVESETGAPCLFLQGASGELAPIEQYTGDVNVADRHGRSLGYACLSLLETMAGGRNGVRYRGCLESGAPLALWENADIYSPKSVAARTLNIDLPIRGDLPSLKSIEEKLARQERGFAYERLLRQIRVRRSVGDGNLSRETAWHWTLGGIDLVAVPFEAYSILQKNLRKGSRQPVFVLNLSNGSLGYLPPEELYRHDIYSAWQTPYGQGSLEKLIETIRNNLGTDNL